jgi:type I restriction enzyme R subunit
MKQALTNYARGETEDESAEVPEKSRLFELLDDAIDQGTAFCVVIGIDLRAPRGMGKSLAEGRD